MQTKRGDFAVGYMSSKVIAAGGLGNGNNNTYIVLLSLLFMEVM